MVSAKLGSAIEMRWLKRRIDYTGVTQGHQPDTETVLQSRFLGERVTWHGKAGAIRRPEWSEWADVPLTDVSVIEGVEK